MKKRFLMRFLALVWVVMTVMAIIPVGAITVDASTSEITREQAVQWAKDQTSNPKDYDGAYGVQCVDLAVAYYKYLGEKSPGGNGCDYATNKLPSGWTRIKNSYGFVPEPGDIAVWTKTGSVNGHVAIVLYADLSTLTVAEFLGSTHTARIHTYSYSYGTFYGVIRPDFPTASNSQVRQTVVDYMMDMATVKWTAGETFQTVLKRSTDKRLTWHKGTTYYGIPYSQTTKAGVNFESFKTLLDNGSFIWEEPGQNDCSYAIYQAWKRVDPDVAHLSTSRMNPGVSNIVAVGNYTFNTDKKTTCTTNGQLTMSNAYSCLQPGDAVVRDGHVMMIVENNASTHRVVVVHQSSSDRYYNGTNTSYSTTNVNTRWGINEVRTYAELFSDGYIPITCKALADNTPSYTPSFERNPQLVSWVSAKGEGYTAEEATQTTNGTTQTRYYYWFKMYDGNTGDLVNTWDSRDYTVTMNIYYSDGSLAGSYSYQKSDVNWISWVPSKADTYKCEVVLSGGWKGTSTVSFTVSSKSYTVSYNANGGSNAPSSQTKHHGTDLMLSSSVPTRTGYTFLGWATTDGAYSPTYYPGSTYSADSSVTLYAVWSANRYCITYDANGGSYSLYQQYKDHGETITLSSTEPTRPGYTFEGWATNSNATSPRYYPGSPYSGNADVTLYAVWSRDTYTITYNANGGSNAPASQTKTHGHDLTITSAIPTGKTYTVTFNGNGGTVSASSKQFTQTFVEWNTAANGLSTSYPSGSVYSVNSSITLYAEWKNPTFSATDPTRLGYYFLGWYDSTEVDNYGLPLGKKYAEGDEITSNLTLYAVWGTSPTMLFGDYNLDGIIEFIPDASAFNRYRLLADCNNAELNFRGDVNADGIVDMTDIELISQVANGSISYTDLPAYQLCAAGLILNRYPKRTYAYGEAFDDSDLCFVAYYSVTAYHSLTDNIVVLGYDPYKVGTQTVTISYYQYKETMTVTVNAPEYSVYYNANGGNNAPSAQTKVDGTPLTLSSKIPTKTGYIFMGWATSGSATTATYQAGGTYSNNANVTLYAVWKANEYTVSYNANGGSNAPVSQTKVHGTNLTLSSTIPTKTGYTFVGWATSSGASAASYHAGSTYSSNASVTFYAVWSKNTYTITYNANGGSNAPSIQTKYYEASILLSEDVPNKEGYTFVGWATSSSATTPSYYPGSPYSGNANITLYAVWSRNTYTVTYDANGGSNAPASQTKDHGTNLTLSSTIPAKTGYTFMGWAITSDATMANYQPGGMYSENANVTLYAVWKANSYTVTYNANGGSNAPDSQTKEHGKGLTLSYEIPTRAGYTFVGWAMNSNTISATYQAGGTYSGNANATLYAVWKVCPGVMHFDTAFNAMISKSGEMMYYTFTPPTNGTYVIYSTSTNSADTKVYLYDENGTELAYDDDSGEGNNFCLKYYMKADTTYTFGVGYRSTSTIITGNIPVAFGRIYNVLYNANGGTNAPTAQTKVYGLNLTLSSAMPTRTGYTFQGWGLSSSDTTVDYLPGGTYSNNSNVTLYARWKANTYTVTYNANGGTNAPAAQTKVHDTNLTISSTIPTRTGYAFMGWATNSTATTATYQAGGAYGSNASITLYAVWKANTYTVTYNANGGTNAPATQTKVHDTNLTISSTIPTRTGYTFMGWATTSGAAAASYQAGGTYSENANVTLFAVWKANTYTVTYNANGGTNAPAAQKKVHDTNLTLSYEIPTKTGYTFMGWAMNSNSITATYQAGGTYSGNANVTLYAVWKANSYTVKYNANGGSNAPESQTKEHGTILTLSSTIPTKTGYTFMGWATNKNATSANYQAGDKYSSNSDVTLYAIWQKKHTHTFNQQITDSHYKKKDATCQSKAAYYYSCSCGEKGTQTFEYGTFAGHIFTNYSSDNNATYTEDGTKTARCDHCNEIDTVIDVGSALGLEKKFKDEFAKLTENASVETTYKELYSLLQTYSTLSAEEKAHVVNEFATVQQLIIAYNEQVEIANRNHAEATEIAFTPLTSTGFAFLAALWFVLKKKFGI